MVYNGANSRSKRGGRFVYADGFVVVGLRMLNIYVATFVLERFDRRLYTLEDLASLPRIWLRKASHKPFSLWLENYSLKCD